jgi:Tol biopolymer transport system component/DNA-binding winged helix-turn-helix (wHTH) protein
METVQKSQVIYEFGKFVLDPQERLLFYEDEPVHLRAKEFETLLLFLENNGRSLSKEEMISVLWQGEFVEEGNLAKQISRLRKVLKSSGDELIQTIPKHGYRFSADVNLIHCPAGETFLRKRTFGQRPAFRIQNEFQDAKARSPLPRRKRVSQVAGLAVFGLIVLSAGGAAWFWQKQKHPVEPGHGASVFLTDASHENNSANWVGENQIYFSRRVSPTRTETWRMNADGSDQHRANREIQNLLYGRWSPDGKKVVFVKEGDGKTLYLADSNGGNEIVLPFIGGNMDWSPDGSKFVYQSSKDEKGNYHVFLYTLATGQSVRLTNGNFGSADPSFSPDGKQIAFTSFRDGNVDIYVMNADGSNVRRVTDHPAFDNYPVFSPDGTQIAFQSNRENERTEIYLQNLEGDLPPVKIASHNGETGIHPKCWSPDGTQILFWTNQNGKAQIVLSNVEPYPARLVLSDEKASLNFPRLAPDGQRMLYQAGADDGSIELRLTDLANKKTLKIYKTSPDYPTLYLLAPAWSPDGQKIAFNAKWAGNSEIFMVNADGTGLRNLTNYPLADTSPVFLPDGGEIIFTRDFYGEAVLYRMNADGSDSRRVTTKDGHEMGAAISPDGSTLAFSVDRLNADSRGLDIYLLDLNDPGNEKRLTSLRFHESFPTFSTDGKRIAFVSNADGNAEIYLMNTDGTGLVRLTRSKWQESAPQFTPDGKKLIYAADRSGKFAIYELELP